MKNYLKALLFFFVASVTLVSCSDDDDSKVEPNEFTLDGVEYAITSSPQWIEGSHGAANYIQFTVNVAGDDNPTIIKLYPQQGASALEGSYTYSDEGTVGTYYLRASKNADGTISGSDWTMDFSGSDGGSNLVITLEDDGAGIYDILVSNYILSTGQFDFSAGFAFVEDAKIAFSLHFRGTISPIE